MMKVPKGLVPSGGPRGKICSLPQTECEDWGKSQRSHVHPVQIMKSRPQRGMTCQGSQGQC